jgi:capsular exopolysaccharide synthesis family protein
MLGLGVAIVVDRADHRIRSREDAERAYGLPVLAEVPVLTGAQQRSSELVAASAPLSRAAEAYRAVRSSLMFQRTAEERGREPSSAFVVLVASASPREGKTTTSANLAALFAETGRRVLAVNCDFRRPTLHQFFDVPHEPRRVVETKIRGLSLVMDVAATIGTVNPALVVEEQRRLIASARKSFDVIVVDTAPMLATNDATEIMGCADLALIVCRAGMTTSDDAARVRELLSRIGAPVSGVVLLGSVTESSGYYYHYAPGRAGSSAGDNRARKQEGASGLAAPSGNGDATADVVGTRPSRAPEPERRQNP